MAQGRIEIKFKPTGDKALILAVKQLDVATKRLQGTTSKYEKEVEEVERAHRRLNRQMKRVNAESILGVKNQRLLSNSFATLRSKMLLVSFGLGLLTIGFRKLFDATIEQERVEKKLEHQLGRVSKGLLNYASGLQAVTKFGDEAIIGVQGMLAAFTKDEEQIKLATQATLDLAEAKGMDLKSAGDLVSKTLGSSTNALARYGIEVHGSANSILRLESLTRNISTLFAGEAASAADTFGGQITQMTNSVGDANEAIGNYLQPIMKRIAGFIKNAADSTKEFFTTLQEDELDTMIRKFEELGVSGEELQNLKSFALKKDLEEVNAELEKTGSKFESIEDVRNAISNQGSGLLTDTEKINKAITERERLQRKLVTLEEAYYGAIDSGLSPLQDAHKMVQFRLRGSGRLVQMSLAEMQTQIDTTANILQKDQAYKNATRSAGEGVEKTIQENQNLAEILKLMLRKKEIQDLLNQSGQEDPVFKLTIEDIQNYTETWAGSIMNVANQYVALQQAQLDTAKQRELDVASNIKWEKKRTKEIEKINAKYEAKQDQLNKKAKRIKRVQTVVNTAAGIMEAMAAEDLSATGKIVMATLVGVMGALQLATIDAQKYAQGGYVGGRRHSQGGTLIEAEQGEYVISRKGVEAAGIENLNRINAGGGSGSVNISFAGNVMSKDFIEDEAIPQIKEAIRRGADIGIG